MVVSRHLVSSRRLVFSPQGVAGNPKCHVFFRFSMGSFHGVPVPVLPSSIFFNLTEQRNFRSCYPQYRWTVHTRLSALSLPSELTSPGTWRQHSKSHERQGLKMLFLRSTSPLLFHGGVVMTFSVCRPLPQTQQFHSLAFILQGVVRVGNKVRRSTRPVERRSPHKVCSFCIRRKSLMRKRRNCVFKQSVRNREFRGP